MTLTKPGAALAALAAVGTLVLAGCGDSDDSSASADTASVHSASLDAATGARAPSATSAQVQSGAAAVAKAGPGPDPVRRALVHRGDVALSSDDAAAAAADVRRIASRYGGRIDAETTDAHRGDVRRVDLTLRVPSGRFDAAYTAISGVGRLTSANRSTEDLTTQVIDVGVRVRSQRASIRRVQQLLDRASTLGQVIDLESQLTQRQEELDSLEQRQAYLQDQTSLSTIHVLVTRSEQHAAAPAARRTGFLGGLERGWHALGSVATVFATVAGSVLPFAVVALVLAVPVWWLLRGRVRAARAGSASAQP